MSSITLIEAHENLPAAAATQAEAVQAPSNVTELPSTASTFALKRTGHRPTVFSGRELCTGTSYSNGPSLWYELNVYQSVDQHYFVEIKMFSKSDAFKDVFRVFDAYSIDDVAEIIESYDPGADVTGLLKMDDALSPAKFALEAAALKMRMEEATVQYKDLAGEMLFHLCD